MWSSGTSARRTRLPADWTVTRHRILERDGYRCYVCGESGANQVDHIKVGDDHRDCNLAAIHDNPCHRIKSAREGGIAAGRRWKRPMDKHPGLI